MKINKHHAVRQEVERIFQKEKSPNHKKKKNKNGFLIAALDFDGSILRDKIINYNGTIYKYNTYSSYWFSNKYK